MSLLEGALYIGVLIGSLSSSYVYKLTSAPIVFAIAAAFTFISVIYVIFGVKESVQNTEQISKSVCLLFIIHLYNYLISNSFYNLEKIRSSL